MRTLPSFLTLLACALGCTACSSPQAYGTGQAWQRNECNKIIDAQERQRCMANANVSYETYQRQQDELKKAPHGE
jgi:hypothetical protein